MVTLIRNKTEGLAKGTNYDDAEKALDLLLDGAPDNITGEYYTTPNTYNFLIIMDDKIELAYYGYDFIDSRMRTREAEVMNARTYGGGSNFVVDFNITNLSKFHFKYCEITAKLRPKLDKNATFFEEYKNHFFPLRSKSKVLENGLARGETGVQRINFENFKGDSNLSIQLTSECF